MVYMNNDEPNIEVESTNETESELEEVELLDEEQRNGDKLKQLREKLRHCEEGKKLAQDDLQRARADFLNARKRIEDDRARDRVRYRIQHVEDMLPLCDSFEMAMSNQEAWEKADEAWRKGVEGIYAQLQRILESYNVKVINPKGKPFDPHRDEAVGTEVVTDEKLVDTVVTVLQSGYEMQIGDTAQIIRHARVTTGSMNS